MAGYVYLGSRYIGECKAVDGTVSGLMVAPGNIYWTGSTWAIDDVNLSHDTFGASGWSASTTTGIVSGKASSYFTYNDLSTIRNLTLSYGDYNDWRIPTMNEVRKLYFDTSRDPALLNGNEVRCFDVTVTSTGTPYGTYISSGFLIFPNNMAFTATITNFGPPDAYYTTQSELNNLIGQGVYFHKIIGSYGYYYGNSGAFWRYSYESSSLGTNVCTTPFGVHITEGMDIPEYVIWDLYSPSGADPNYGNMFGWGQTYQGGNDTVIGIPIRFVRGSITD